MNYKTERILYRMKLWSQQTVDPPVQTISLSNLYGAATASLEDNQLAFHHQPGLKQKTQVWEMPGLTPETIKDYKRRGLTIVLGYCHNEHARCIHLKTLLENLPKDFNERKVALKWTTMTGPTWITEFGTLDTLAFCFETDAQIMSQASNEGDTLCPMKEVHTIEQGLQELIDSTLDVLDTHISFYKAVIDDIDEILDWEE